MTLCRAARPPTKRQSLSSGVCFFGAHAHGGRAAGGMLCRARDGRSRDAEGLTPLPPVVVVRDVSWPWRRVAKTGSRQTWAMRRPPSRRLLHKRRMRGGWRHGSSARSDIFVPSSIFFSSRWPLPRRRLVAATRQRPRSVPGPGDSHRQATPDRDHPPYCCQRPSDGRRACRPWRSRVANAGPRRRLPSRTSSRFQTRSTRSARPVCVGMPDGVRVYMFYSYTGDGMDIDAPRR